MKYFCMFLFWLKHWRRWAYLPWSKWVEFGPRLMVCYRIFHTCGFFSKKLGKDEILRIQEINLNCFCAGAENIFAMGRYASMTRSVIKIFVKSIFVSLCTYIWREIYICINICTWSEKIICPSMREQPKYSALYSIHLSICFLFIMVFTCWKIMGDTVRCMKIYLSDFNQLLYLSACI